MSAENGKISVTLKGEIPERRLTSLMNDVKLKLGGSTKVMRGTEEIVITVFGVTREKFFALLKKRGLAPTKEN